MNKKLNILFALSAILIFSADLFPTDNMIKKKNNMMTPLNVEEAENDEFTESLNGKKTDRMIGVKSNRITMKDYNAVTEEYKKNIQASIDKINENLIKIKNTTKLSDDLVVSKNIIDSELEKIRNFSETFSVLNVKNNNELKEIIDKNNEKHALKDIAKDTYLRNFNEKLELNITLDEFTKITKGKKLNDIKPPQGVTGDALIGEIEDLIKHRKKSTDINALEINKSATFNQLTGKTKMFTPTTKDIIDAILTVWVKGRINDKEKYGETLYKKIIELLTIMSESKQADSITKINLHGHSKVTEKLTGKTNYALDKEKSKELTSLISSS